MWLSWGIFSSKFAPEIFLFFAVENCRSTGTFLRQQVFCDSRWTESALESSGPNQGLKWIWTKRCLHLKKTTHFDFLCALVNKTALPLVGERAKKKLEKCFGFTILVSGATRCYFMSAFPSRSSTNPCFPCYEHLKPWVCWSQIWFWRSRHSVWSATIYRAQALSNIIPQLHRSQLSHCYQLHPGVIAPAKLPLRLLPLTLQQNGNSTSSFPWIPKINTRKSFDPGRLGNGVKVLTMCRES